ncbi:hypothetical protein CIT292_09385 [Citrobacter youngae ATCC 29220]|uniref:Uncharacterized protein n=1 Tax=Citrobacter youngae ATCC 29220 TaxID=500640 RepID=D4BF19_9ENTR|nr:hypothetical protein CIT292_09385 [Citrobacter youngae ATCC 29220]
MRWFCYLYVNFDQMVHFFLPQFLFSYSLPSASVFQRKLADLFAC